MVTLEDIKQLVTQGDTPTLSLYLDVDLAKQENQAANPAWRIYLKHAINDIEADAKNTDDWLEIKKRFDAFVDDYTPDEKGLAAFFTPTAEQVYRLPVPVENRWSFGKPLIAPLLWAVDEYEPYLIVMVDQEKAQLITAYLGNTTVEDRLETDVYEYDFGQKTLMPATSAVVGGHPLTQGSNREAYQNMINEHTARFHREVVDHLEKLVQKHPHIRIVIGGEEHSAHAVRGYLPKQLEPSLVGVLPIPMKTGEHEILERILPEAMEYERKQELDLVQEVIDFAKSGGRGALGRKAVDEALTMQRVETLLLPYPAEDEAEATDFSARAFESGGTVELIHGEAADRLREEGEVAARLYYAL